MTAAGPTRTVAETFRPSERLRRRAEFLAAQTHGRKLHTENFVIFSYDSGRPGTRLGVTASKKVGNSVVRNRVRRRVRELFRRNKASFPERRDLVVVAKRSAADLDQAAIARELLRGARRLTGAR